MTSNKKKILFVKMGSFSHTNESMLNVLKREFPEYSIDIIDIWDDIINIKSFSNIFNAFIQYGPSMFRSKKRFIDCLVKNNYIFTKVKAEINKYLVDKQYLFTFQTQSLFDSSVEGIPNYMYTDHTYLVNKDYFGFDLREIEYFRQWIELEKSIYHNAKFNFTMSTNITNSIIKDYKCPKEKVKCIYAGSNVKIDTKKVISNERFSSKNILFVGINWERKGGPTLEKAFEVILKKHPDATLTIVGCSPEINLNNCNIIGKVPLEEVQKYYECASIFCLPTMLEPFGMVFIEAMSNRLPIIATNIGAIPDFVVDEKNGYKVKPGDVEELAKKLMLLLGEPKKCEEFGNYGFNNILPKYTWEQVGKEMKKNILNSLEK